MDFIFVESTVLFLIFNQPITNRISHLVCIYRIGIAKYQHKMSLVDNSELPVGVNDYLYKLCRPSLDSASLVAGKCIQSFGSL